MIVAVLPHWDRGSYWFQVHPVRNEPLFDEIRPNKIHIIIHLSFGSYKYKSYDVVKSVDKCIGINTK
jgi:hypothetical protein